MRILKDNLSKTMKPFVKLVDGQWCMKPTKVDEAIDAIINTYGEEGCVGIITNDFGRVFFVVYAADVNRLRKVQEYYIGVTIPNKKAEKKEIKPVESTAKSEEIVSMSDVFKPIKGDNYVILKNIGQLSASEKGWKKELNLVEWHGKEAKYDIRDWDPDYKRCGKGGTFSEDELRNLYAVLKQMFENENPETETKIEKCSLDDLYKRWDDLVSYAPSVIRSKLMTSRVDTLPNNRVIVSLKKGNYDALASDENRRVLQNFISNIVDQDVHVELVESSLL